MPLVTATPPTGLAVFTMTLLRAGARYLLLRRAESKAFAPGRWTGVGGRVEPGELHDLESAALREIAEETGLTPSDVSHLCMRRALLQHRPGHPLTVLVYLTGEIQEERPLASCEGTLHWVAAQDFNDLDIIENTAEVLPLLVDDILRDPKAHGTVITGAAFFASDGSLTSLVWSK
jgi:8-oxo-dGTP diphosphatase